MSAELKQEGRMRRLQFVVSMLLLASGASAPSHLHAQSLLIPMDNAQSNHLKAYGLTFWVIDHKMTAEWLLNYRAGSFVLPDKPEIRKEAALRGVSFDAVTEGELKTIHGTIEQSNMETVLLEKAPRIAVYTPQN